MTSHELAITTDKLTVRSDSKVILNAITLAVPRGAVVGLVGRNGAGKSTLLRCLAGLTEPDEGSSTLLGCPSLQLHDGVRAHIGYVAQTPDLFEWLTVIDHLKLIGSAYLHWNEERCMVLAARLALPLFGKVRELSGGDQQKLAVVLALAHDPDLLLLDEPVASLDPMTRQEFMRAMFGNREDDGRTVIISSHILTDLERVVSHVAFMREGRLQLFDTWDAMLDYLRLVDNAVLDIRAYPDAAERGRVMTLGELFAALNA